MGPPSRPTYCAPATDRLVNPAISPSRAPTCRRRVDPPKPHRPTKRDGDDHHRPPDRTPASAPAASATVRSARRAPRPGLLASAQFVVMLDTSIVNVALPSIQADLGLESAGVTWVVNAYVLTFGGLLLLSGRVADLFGRRRMFIGGLGPVHRRHPAGRRRRQRGDAGGRPRHPGRRRRRAQPGRHVAAPADLPRSSSAPGR